MSDTAKMLFTIFLIVTGVFIIVKWDKIRAYFSSKNSGDKSDYDKCIEGHKSQADNEPCVSCRPAGSGMATYGGVIKNGVCERKPAVQDQAPVYSNKIQITKVGGTRTFAKDSTGNIVSPQTANTIPEGTILIVTEVISKPKTYYNTSYGWVDANDATVIV